MHRLSSLCVGAAAALFGGAAVPFSIASSAFANGTAIPRRYTCDDADISPPLAWNGVPRGTRALALIVDDPDAPARTWVHWVLYDVPATITALRENAMKTDQPKELEGAAQGKNDFKRVGYA